MAQPLNSSYEWGIDPENQGNLSAAQLIGLGSLSPQMGLSNGAPYTPLPSGQYPTPTFSPGAAGQVMSDVGAGSPASQTATGPDVLQAKVDQGGGGNQPYFDPNYPYESMLALKNWLAPQVGAGVAGSMQARGVDYTGLGPEAQGAASNYLSQLTPVGETGQQALGNDYDFLYGPDVANSLVQGSPAGSTVTAPGGGTTTDPYAIPASIPGGGTYGNGSTGGVDAELIANPSGNLGRPPGQIGFPEQTAGGAQSPLFGLVSDAGNAAYAGPGYQYNPNQPPPANLPWLGTPTPYGGNPPLTTNV